MAISLTHIDFDKDNPNDSQNIGAFVRAGSDGDQIASQTINAEEWLNVAAVLYDDAGAPINNANPLDVNVTNTLGIDVDLDHTEDSVRLGDGTDLLTSTTVGADIGLDVNLINTEIAVTQGTDSPWAVEATDLDIRQLDHTSAGQNDSVRLGDGTDFITSTLVGSDQALDVNVVAATGSDDALADTAIANGATTVGTSAGSAVASALASRKYLWLLNNSIGPIYLGTTGVSAANGFPLYRFGAIEMRAGASVDVQAIGATAGRDLRYLELS